jgi:hypothetical protein
MTARKRRCQTSRLSVRSQRDMEKKDVVKAVAKAKAKLVPAVRPGAPKPTGGKPVKKATELDAFLWAEGEQESGNNYTVVNANSGALGRWQVMPENLASWLAESGLPDMTAEQYLHNTGAQIRLAETILGGDFKKWGPRGAASVWYSGQPDWQKTYGDPPVYQYVDDVVSLMSKYPGGGFNVPAGGTPPAGKGVTVISGSIPAPGKDDWSTDIKLATSHLTELTRSVHNHTTTLARLKVKS